MNRIDSQELEARLRRLFKLRVWVAETLRLSELQITLVWAAAIGVAGAIAAYLFHAGMDGLHQLLTGQPGLSPSSFRNLPWWQRLLVPTAGGALAGWVLHQGWRLGRSEKSSDYMEAIVLGDGRISFRTSLIKSVSALFSGASGGSIGREGPMVQLSAMLASLVGVSRSFTLPRRRQLVACGAAAGIASAYNAPISGAFFVAEIVLGSISMDFFGPLVVSSVAATLVTHLLWGEQALYHVPAFRLHSTWEVVGFVVLGVLCGALVPLYLRFLRGSERWFSRLPVHRVTRLALGGAVVGALAILHPEVCGNGASVLYEILRGNWFWEQVALVLGLKLIATASTFGSGAVGGVFTPTLVTGAGIGSLFGSLVSALFPHAGLQPHAYALVGMGAFLAGATAAPIMAIFMLFELTLDYQVVLPLMLACVVGYFTAKTSERTFLYGEAMERKGARAAADALGSLRVRELMRTDPVHVPLTARFREIAESFLQNRFNYLYVVDAQGLFAGVISLHDVKGYLDEPDPARVLLAADVVREDFPTITPDGSLEAALLTFERTGSERIPVVESVTEPRLLGSLSKTDLLLHLAGRAPRH